MPSENGDNVPRPGTIPSSRSSTDSAAASSETGSYVDAAAANQQSPPPPPPPAPPQSSPPESPAPSRPPRAPGAKRGQSPNRVPGQTITTSLSHPLGLRRATSAESDGDVSALSAISSAEEEPGTAHNQKTVEAAACGVEAFAAAANQLTAESKRTLQPKAAGGSHRRKVSWGGNNNDLYQPDLNDDTGGGGSGGTSMNATGANNAYDASGGGAATTGGLPPSALKPKPYIQRQHTGGSGTFATHSPGIDSNNATGARTTTPGHIRRNTRITLTDITSNPLEDEAENAIIRALEAREWETQQKFTEDQELQRALHGGKNDIKMDSVRVGILTGIPDAALQMVMEEEDAAASASVAAGVKAANDANSSSTAAAAAGGAEGVPLLNTLRVSTIPGKAPPSPTPTHGGPTPRSPKPSQTGSIHSKSGGGHRKFQDIAAQLKNAQTGGGGRATSTTAHQGGTGGYLLKAAAAYKAAHGGQSTQNVVGSGKSRPSADVAGSAASGRLAHLDDNNDSDRDDDPISAGDAMVKNMNKMLGLPNKNEEEGEEERRRKESDAFDLEAQPTHPPSPKPTAAQRWGKLRSHVVSSEGGAEMAADAFKSAGAAAAAAPNSSSLTDERTSQAEINGSKKNKYATSWCACLPFNRFFKKCSDIYADLSSTHQTRRKIKFLIWFLILPSLFISTILFYAANNPMPGTPKERRLNPTAYASYSWWIMFIGARQVCTLALSRCTEVLMVDVLTLRTRTVFKIFGPFVSLLIIQGRGWPYIICFWAVWDFAFLQGKHSFAKHWLFYVPVGLFNECRYDLTNPENNIEYPDCNSAGNVTYSDIYFRILISMIIFGCSVALKRVGLALYQGKKSTGHYGPQLEQLMKTMLFVTEIAHLAAEIEAAYENPDGRGSAFGYRSPDNSGFDFKKLQAMKRGDNDSDSDSDNDDQDSASKRSSQASPPSLPSKNTLDDPSMLLTAAGAGPGPAPDTANLRDSTMRYRTNTEDLQSVRTFTSIPTKATLGADEASEAGTVIPSLGGHRVHSALGESNRQLLMDLVGEWEEPTITAGRRSKTISIQDVLQFRQAVLCLDSKNPFSYEFGPANTRENCIESAQNVYNRLLLHKQDEPILQFDTLALICLDKDGTINEKKARKLIRLFRPARDGTLTALDFVKSCDKVYKDIRTLRANIANSSQLDLALESLVNVCFYFILWLIVLTIVKLDPWALFLSLSGFVLSFAFMIGSAASKYFEGILLILIQKPYDIGDRVHISNSQNDTSANGSATWFVEGVNLYSTTVRYAATNEVATHSNGSLSASRIINANRSPKAQVFVYLKFAIDVPYERVMLFKSVIEEFVKERPREWIAMGGFRATRVEADLGYIEYVIVLQHVEKWQNIGPILNSKAEVSSYCLEVQKKLGMRYEAPPLPVNLGINKAQQMEQSVFEREQVGGEGSDLATSTHSEPDFSMLAALFSKPEAKKTRQ